MPSDRLRVPEFQRIFEIRAGQLMWLLGAGASVAAGIPTAFDMTWDFKRTLYRTSEGRSLASCADLGDPRLQGVIQRFLDAQGGFPPLGDVREYSDYFEAAYRHERDRRAYVDKAIEGRRPSYGHHVLAALMREKLCSVLATTNFDGCIEDSAAQAFSSTTALRVGDFANPNPAEVALRDSRFPVLMKLHGDFRSDRLKNTKEELRANDSALRSTFTGACSRFGLVVVGYSGRDDSLMNALTAALDFPNPFASGIFWCARAGDGVLPVVTEFLRHAIEHGVEAHLVEIAGFDEFLADLARSFPSVESSLPNRGQFPALRLTPEPLAPQGAGTSWPVLRLNALPLLRWPETCRFVDCGIGGMKEVREAIAKSGRRIVAARRKAGVMAFGADSDVRAVFEPYSIKTFTVHALDAAVFEWDSHELGLVYDALCAALTRSLPLKQQRIRSRLLLVVDPTHADAGVGLKPIRDVVGALFGNLPNGPLKWFEAAEMGLQFLFGRLWLLIRPTIWVERPPIEQKDPVLDDARMDFIREQAATRYNKRSNELIHAWAAVLTRGEPTQCYQALGISAGIDAGFELSRTTAYSRRATK